MMKNKIRKVVLGMSGGVDSAVSAKILKDKGFQVYGAFLKNWDEIDETGVCSGEKDFADAEFICKKLEIPVIKVNFVKDYWNFVFEDFLDDYKNGLTPNPDILCNRYIKFDKFFKFAKNSLNADAIATGHYAQSSFGNFLENYNSNKEAKLLIAADSFKDQTFFLSRIRQEALRNWMFPIGNLEKKRVKEIAKEIGLENIAAKKESTGICFIGKRNFKEFINTYVDDKPGDFVDIDTEQIIGSHNGIHQWTIGQRCKISGCLKPYFVSKKDPTTNVIFVAAGSNHPSLYSKILCTHDPSWIRNIEITKNLELKFRFQHTKPLVKCTISENYNNFLKIDLEKPLRAITPGQFGVFYLENECLGSVRILSDDKLDKKLKCSRLLNSLK